MAVARPFARATSSSAKSFAAPPRTVFTGIQPTGVPHLGNYFGVVETWLRLQTDEPSTSRLIFSVVDLHAITYGRYQPAELRDNVRKMTAGLLAYGVDPKRTLLFKQSDVPEHAQLAWMLGCLATTARLQKMPQFKDKSEIYRKEGNIPVGLLTYPILQTADVFLYRACCVPVGEDQVHHMNLMSDVSKTFYDRFGVQYFPNPQSLASTCPKLKSLRDPLKKMSKSDVDVRSRIELSDPPDVVLSKCMKSVTDTKGTVSYEPDTRPGVSNLLTLLSLVTQESIQQILLRYPQQGDTVRLKRDLAASIAEKFEHCRFRYEDLLNNDEHLTKVLAEGGEAARDIAAKNIREIKHIFGFI